MLRAACSALLVIISLPVFAQSSNKHSLLGKTDLHALLEAAPAIPASVQAAVSRAYGSDIVSPDYQLLEKYYEPLYAKVKTAQQEFERYAVSLQNFQQAEGTAGMTRTVKETNKRTDQLPELPGTRAMMQKYMSDKAWAARFDAMNEREKEVVMKEFMEAEKKGSSTAAIPVSYNGFEKELKQKNKVISAIDIQDAISGMFLRMEQLTEEYTDKVKTLATEAGGFAALEADYKRSYDQIPLIVMGEGKDKDPKALRALILQDVALKRARNAEELSRKAIWLTELKAKYKLVVNDYNDLLQKYKGAINGNVKDLYNGTNTELGLAQFEMSLMDLASRLAKFSEQATEAAARTEREQYFRTRP